MGMKLYKLEQGVTLVLIPLPLATARTPLFGEVAVVRLAAPSH